MDGVSCHLCDPNDGMRPTGDGLACDMLCYVPEHTIKHLWAEVAVGARSAEPNCRAEVVLVQGDHRVAILAAQDIAAGQELTLDYRYDQARAPAWHNA